MKRYIYSLILLVVLINSNSCKKSFLNVEDNSDIMRQKYVKDLPSLQQFLNGVYVVLAKDFYARDNQVYPEVIADNIKPSPDNLSVLFSHYNWNQGTSDYTQNRNDLWNYGYQIIRSCSFVLEKSEEFSKENEVKVKQLQAEAYSIRALVHFILVNTFAQSYNFSTTGAHPGIPFITTSDWTQPYKRNTVAEVYSGIITDLKTAISLFQPGAINTLTMNQNAAKALLARCYLFKEDYQQAKTTALEVANAVPLLVAGSYPSKLFTLQETEALFQLAPASTKLIPGGYNTYFQGLYLRSTFTYFFATKDIATLLTINANDSRKSWVNSGGPGLDSIRKYPINIITGFGANGTDTVNMSRSYYQTLLRSSEMFLTVAEAAAQTGDEPTARNYLDAIRKRANTTAPISTASGAALLDSIYLERRKELAFEGLRMFDILRWKKGVTRSDVALGGPSSLPYPSDKAIAPIPLLDSQTGIPQNSGY